MNILIDIYKCRDPELRIDNQKYLCVPSGEKIPQNNKFSGYTLSQQLINFNERTDAQKAAADKVHDQITKEGFALCNAYSVNSGLGASELG